MTLLASLTEPEESYESFEPAAANPVPSPAPTTVTWTEVDSDALAKSLSELYGTAARPADLPFCRPDYELRARDSDVCPLTESGKQLCPELKRACAELKPEPPPDRELSFGALGPTIEVLFWGIIALALVALIVTIVRRFGGRSPAPEEKSDGETQPRGPQPPPPVVETDVTRLLELARRARSAGDFGKAIDCLHQAVLRGLGAAGHLDVARGRTNGDYRRELATEPELQQAFTQIARRVESAQFGGVGVNEAAFETVQTSALGLLRRLSLLALVGLLLGGCGAPSGGHSFSESPHGLNALKRILTDQGVKIRTRVEPIEKVDPNLTELVLFDLALEEDQQLQLQAFVESGGSLIIASPQPELEALFGITREWRSEKCEATGAVGSRSFVLGVPGHTTLKSSPVESAGVGEGDALAQCSDHAIYVLEKGVSDGWVTVFAESELFENAALSVADNAAFMADFLVQSEVALELVGPWTGQGSSTPFSSLHQGGLVPVLLQLLAFGLILGLRHGTAFGVRRDKVERHRRAFVEHVKALGSVYARARASHHVVGSYANWAIEQLRERTCPGQKPTLFSLASVVARRAQRPENEVVKLLVEAKCAHERSESTTADIELMKKLETLIMQCGGVS